MFWTIALIILAALGTGLLYTQRFFQPKTLWNADVTATIWFCMPQDDFEHMKTLVEEYNDAEVDHSGVTLIAANFESDKKMFEKLDDALSAVSIVYAPEAVWSSEQYLKRMYEKALLNKLVTEYSIIYPNNFSMVPTMTIPAVMHIDKRAFFLFKHNVQSFPNIGNVDDNKLLTFEGIMETAEIYRKWMKFSGHPEEIYLKPFLAVDNLYFLLISGIAQLGGNVENMGADTEILYAVWHFIVRGVLLGDIVISEESGKQLENKKIEPILYIGFGDMHLHDLLPYPVFKDFKERVVPLRKIGFGLVQKKTITKQTIAVISFIKWFMQERKNLAIAGYSACLPIIDGETFSDFDQIKESNILFGQVINEDEEDVEFINKRAELVCGQHSRLAYQEADFFLDNDHAIYVVKCIKDFINDARAKLNSGYDYKVSDSIDLQMVLSRESFNDWLHRNDLFNA